MGWIYFVLGIIDFEAAVGRDTERGDGLGCGL
jgi:hypothetical protein